MKLIVKITKIYSVLLFMNIGLFFIAMLTGAMRDGGVGKLFLILFIGWMIAVTIYFAGAFIQKVDRAEERFESIEKKYKRISKGE